MTHKQPLRLIAALVAGFFSWTLAGGATAAHAVQLATRQSAPVAVPARSAAEKFARAVAGVETLLADETLPLVEKQRTVKERRQELLALAADVRRELAATENKLSVANLPAAMRDRHTAFASRFEENLKALKAELAAIESAKGEAAVRTALAAAQAHLAKVKAPSRHQPLDPNKLPHRAAEPTKQQPRLKKDEFERVYGKDLASLPRPVRVAALGALPGVIPADNDAPVNLGLPSLDDLAFTADVQLTPAIEAKAAELGHDPLKIYEWVRNNVEFVPTWGSIQGAQMTLETQQGNAFDIASLLIALLRASHIHARYVLGTVELPIDKIQNWAGGFTDPMAALDFMSSGGIPTTALTEGGQVTKARFEHVWVEAWIDYLPSRGARHQDGQGDTWIPLDASFKQYAYSDGLDLQAAVPFDAQSFVDQLKASATIDESQGYATGVNGTLVQQALSDYQSRVEAYIAQHHPDATVGDVLGKKEIVQKDYPYLLGTLPYKTAVRGGAYALLPGSLRHTLSFSVAKGGFDETPLTFKQSLPELAGKKITLSYTPATAADEAVIDSYLPQPHADGTPIQPEELPTSLPAYLINVKPELRIDGQVVATGSPLTLGASETFTMNFFDPASGISPVVNTIVAGSYQAIGLNLGKINKDQFTTFRENLERQHLNESKESKISTFLSITSFVYHAELEIMNFMFAKLLSVAEVTLPSLATFSSNITTEYFFDTPLHVKSSGYVMDADRLLCIVKPIGKYDNNNTKQYMLASGMISSMMESSIPEKLLSSLNYKASSVSAVKLLALANEQSIPIYTINNDNAHDAISRLDIDSDTIVNIKNAINSGNSVIVQSKNLFVDGWYGCGYIVINNNTNSAAYMISGGLNGSWTSQQDQNINCQQRWEQCYSNCIDILVPINPWSAFTTATVVGNILYVLGGGISTITISGQTIVTMSSPLLWMGIYFPLCLSLSSLVFRGGGIYLSWVAGASIGCMASCSLNPCNY